MKSNLLKVEVEKEVKKNNEKTNILSWLNKKDELTSHGRFNLNFFFKKRKKRKKERKLQIRLSAELEKEQLLRKRKRTIFGPRKSKNFSQKKKKKKLFTRTFLTFNLAKFPIRIFKGKTSFWWPHLFKQVVSFKGILNSGNI